MPQRDNAAIDADRLVDSTAELLLYGLTSSAAVTESAR
jgi:hypothetical protein